MLAKGLIGVVIPALVIGAWLIALGRWRLLRALLSGPGLALFAALALPWFVQHPFFDTRATNWVGLVTHKPITEDYVPVLPWLGVALWGLAAGQWVLRHRPVWLGGPLPAALCLPAQPLAMLGRWSLSFYMLHQPVLIGAVMTAAWLLHPQ